MFLAELTLLIALILFKTANVFAFNPIDYIVDVYTDSEGTAWTIYDLGLIPSDEFDFDGDENATENESENNRSMPFNALFSVATETAQSSISYVLDITSQFSINDNEITDMETALTPNDSFNAAFEITNNGADIPNLQLIVALYENNRFLGLAMDSDSFLSNATKPLEVSIEIPQNVSNCRAKVFLWDGFSNLKPVIVAENIGATPVTQYSSILNINCQQNKNYNVVISSENMTDDKIYTIQYSPNKLEITDLCSLTYEKELTTGYIEESKVNILEYSNGTVKFTVDKDNNGSISSVLNSISFTSLSNNENTDILISMEEIINE